MSKQTFLATGLSWGELLVKHQMEACRRLLLRDSVTRGWRVIGCRAGFGYYGNKHATGLQILPLQRLSCLRLLSRARRWKLMMDIGLADWLPHLVMAKKALLETRACIVWTPIVPLQTIACVQLPLPAEPDWDSTWQQNSNAAEKIVAIEMLGHNRGR